jgi:peptidoglycan/xylan/chitin deacetylase (PgdA/CDA1 family)
MYHGIDPESGPRGTITAREFERQVVFLKKHFEIVSVNHMEEQRNGPPAHGVLLTFDDGFRNNFEQAVPILRKHQVPAIFFVSSRHCEPGNYLWFAYIRALGEWFRWKQLRVCGERLDMSPTQRRATMVRLANDLLSLKPHPGAMYQTILRELPPLHELVARDLIDANYAGMTKEQLGELSADPLFSTGVHTVDHPLLTRCEPLEQEQQIQNNKSWLEQVTGKPPEWIAYPGGDYDQETIRTCKRAGIKAGFAVKPVLRRDPAWERPRIGIYSPSLNVLTLKAVFGPRIDGLRKLCSPFRPESV